MPNYESIPTISTQVQMLEARVRDLIMRVDGMQHIWEVLCDEIAKSNRRVAKLEERLPPTE